MSSRSVRIAALPSLPRNRRGWSSWGRGLPSLCPPVPLSPHRPYCPDKPTHRKSVFTQFALRQNLALQVLGFSPKDAYILAGISFSQCVSAVVWAYTVLALGLNHSDLRELFRVALRIPESARVAFIRNALEQTQSGWIDFPSNIEEWYQAQQFLLCATEALRIGLPPLGRKRSS